MAAFNSKLGPIPLFFYLVCSSLGFPPELSLPVKKQWKKLILSDLIFIQCWNFIIIFGARNRVGIGLLYRAHQTT
jgi:hypothetical protein